MQTICLRSVFAGKNVKVGSPLISFSRRLLSNSAVHSQEVELERPKGVPLATDLGGVKVKPSVSECWCYHLPTRVECLEKYNLSVCLKKSTPT